MICQYSPGRPGLAAEVHRFWYGQSPQWLDLVAEHSKTWMMNRFVTGSVTGVRVMGNDRNGRLVRLVAGYQFDGLNGRSRGSVTVQFEDGLPSCLYFFDFPSTCRSPGKRIVNAFENGEYQK